MVNDLNQQSNFSLIENTTINNIIMNSYSVIIKMCGLKDSHSKTFIVSVPDLLLLPVATAF